MAVVFSSASTAFHLAWQLCFGDYKIGATEDAIGDYNGIKILIPCALIAEGNINMVAIIKDGVSPSIAQACPGFDSIIDSLTASKVEVNIQAIAPMLAVIQLSEVGKLVRRINTIEDAITTHLATHPADKALYSNTVGLIPVDIWDKPGHFAILLSFFAERVHCCFSPCFTDDNVAAFLRRWMHVAKIEHETDVAVEAVPSLEQSSYMAANDLSQRDVAILAEKLGEGNTGIAQKLSSLQKQHLFMTLTDDKLGRTPTGRIVRSKLARALYKDFENGCTKSMAKVAGLDGGESASNLLDLLFKATGIEKSKTLDQRTISAFARLLEIAEDLLGTGTFKGITGLENSLVRASKQPYELVDFDAIGRYWIKHVLRFSADKLAAAPGQLTSIDVLYPEEITSIAYAAIMWGKEFNKLVNSAVAFKYEDLRKHYREQGSFDGGHTSPKSQKKGEKGHRTILQKEKFDNYKPSGMCIDFNKDSCEEPCPYGLVHHKIPCMQYARGNCTYGDACKFAHLDPSKGSAKIGQTDDKSRPNKFAASQPSAIKKAGAKLKADN